MSRNKLSAERLERRHEIVRLYRESHGNRPASSLEMADWAMRTGQWKPKPVDLRKQLAEELSRAMSEEFMTDPRNRRVRAKHVARVSVNGKQQSLWVDMRDKNPAAGKLKIIALQNRRQQVVGDLKQLKTDADSFNEFYNYTNEIPFQLILDFTDDIAEAELAQDAA
ncbi:MAG: hypothetical protein H0U54_01025 [Acidobacteria bacterium]|nr:hypothetical protein [Acidobacteriota bacterium]